MFHCTGAKTVVLPVPLTVCCIVFIHDSIPMDEGYLNIGIHVEIFYKASEVVDRILLQVLP